MCKKTWQNSTPTPQIPYCKLQYGIYCISENILFMTQKIQDCFNRGKKCGVLCEFNIIFNLLLLFYFFLGVSHDTNWSTSTNLNRHLLKICIICYYFLHKFVAFRKLDFSLKKIKIYIYREISFENFENFFENFKINVFPAFIF